MEVVFSPEYLVESDTTQDINFFIQIAIFFLQNDCIKDTIMRQKYSGRKRKATGYVLISGSPYLDAEVLTHHRSCLHDEIIKTAPRIGRRLTNQNYIDNFHLEG